MSEESSNYLLRSGLGRFGRSAPPWQRKSMIVAGDAVVQGAATMNQKHETRLCAGCKQLYSPDPRTRHRQTFCGKTECQEAPMEGNRKKWLARPENAHYWRDNPKSKKRVREWREDNPGYWKRSRRTSKGTLHEEIKAKKTG